MKFRRMAMTGSSLVETVIAAGVTLGILAVAFPAFSSVSDAGDFGAARVRVDTETRHALLRMARELENASSTAVDTAGNPRTTIADGLDADPLVYEIVNGQSEMGGFEGTLGSETNDDNSDEDPNDAAAVTGTAQTVGSGNSDDADCKGSGSRGHSLVGRIRSSDKVGTVGFGTRSMRPRHAVIAKNSVVTFQKVADYTVDSTGAPVITWTTPITYQVVNRHLMREQDGFQSVICPTCTGFQAQWTDIGSIMLTIVSQTKCHAKPGIVAEANQVEISPKN